jgi:type II restriction/modification system DNA methylase subunit YeeA
VVTTNNFDKEFWIAELSKLGYHLSENPIPVQFLRERKAIPPGVNLKQGYLIYSDPLTFDIVLLEFDKLPTRNYASRIARYWKAHQQGRQLMLFTDRVDSYAVVIPGTIESESTKARILSLSEMIFRTDNDAIQSLRHVGDRKLLREHYDTEFLPYTKVRADFFEGYRNLYQKIFEIVKEPLGDNASSYSQRFIGRLMFLYFLQKKGWLKNNKRFVDTIKDYAELNWVFYEGLSKEGNDGLPYLDGTLFEREDYFDAKTEERISESMNNIFIEAREFLNQYNFTVDELSPLDVEVSVDPMMIGTIFENMLPENDRGSKGTFYTPPEEISFICRRALAQYLKIDENVINKDGHKALQDGISILLCRITSEKSEKTVRNLRDQILNIKVMDPAVGSGGFLLGMMQEMLFILREADQSVGWSTDMEDYKSRILQNLYGFDIEGEAIEIAKLRLWLSIIVDKKSPEPLPSLDMNLMRINDSLQLTYQSKLDDEIRMFHDTMNGLRSRFINEKDSASRSRLRRELQRLQSDMEKQTGVYGGTIESWGIGPVNIIVMNPPYVRQESIPADRKKHYTANYKIDGKPINKKSDLYCYFVIRALDLIDQNGIVSVISSDKWLETEYGEDLQKKLSTRLIGVYGQRERTFKADINSVIFVYSKEKEYSKTTDFIYLESYLSLSVRNHIQFKRSELITGKWFYLRAPKMFMDKIYPKLTYKLGDKNISEIKFGIKTGANDFFYMKDISASYETDYLADPGQFKDWGVTARNEKELRHQGLIYIQNEGGKRFVLNVSDVKPLVRTTKDLKYYTVREMKTLCLYTKEPGEQTKKYIEWGESQKVAVRGKKDPVMGYNNIPSVSGRKRWYSLNDLEPTNIILPMYVMDRFFIPKSDEPVICDHTLYTLKPKVNGIDYYMNSTIFYMTMELYLRRLGGGGGVGEIMVDDYKQMPVPDLGGINFISTPFNRIVKRYFDEVKTEDRKELDETILDLMCIKDFSLDEFYSEFVELVDDRLIKANRGLKSREENDEQDN